MKTETKGTPTPGPWIAEHERIRAGLHGRVIARVDFGNFNTGAWSYEPGPANARLIAAAPELREYVESIVAWGIAPDSTPATIADIVAEARALLARIDGD